MKSDTTSLLHQAKTPRAAAIAGMLFGILFSFSFVIILLSMPPDFADLNAWTETPRSRVSLALGMMPFAGIAFLWFVGVVRDRLGAFEDQFFATVFEGSGLLFLAMIFCAFAVAAGMLTAREIGGVQSMTMNVYLVGRSIISELFNTVALKMAAVFMISLSTLWLRTGVMPRILCFFTYVVALLMLVSVNVTLWMVLFFPGWVFSISVYILVLSFRAEPAGSLDGMTPKLGAN